MRMLAFSCVAAVFSACGTETSNGALRPVVPLYVDVSPRDGQEAVEQPILSNEEVATIFHEGESLTLASSESEEDMDGVEPPRPEDFEICSKLTGMSPERIVVAGTETRLSMDRETVMALRVIGSRTRVLLNLSTMNRDGLGGLCLFVGGQRPELDVRIAASIDLLVVHTTGDQPRVDITVSKGASVRDWAVRLSGQKPSVTVASPAGCPKGGVSGSGSLVCR